MSDLENAPLGKQSEYIDEYDSSLLFPVPRSANRQRIGISGEELPFFGRDIWNAWEVSWLLPSGKPVVAVAEFYIPCTSPNLIESKSFKLYLNSFNQSRFCTAEEVTDIMTRDLSACAGEPVEVVLKGLDKSSDHYHIEAPSGECIDSLDVEVDQYQPSADILELESQRSVTEILYSDLLKSNCPVTGQPDWATLIISYTGKKLSRASLLKYIISFRQYSEFHEHCAERIFRDLLEVTEATDLTVTARYVRRGGLDINPVRTLKATDMVRNTRLVRQ